MKATRIPFFATALLLLAVTLARPDFAAKQQVHAAPARSAYDINIPILGYHKIGETAPTEWYVRTDEFARQMDVLKYYGYQTISLDDYLDYAAGQGTPPAKPVILTFDDGFENVYQYAAPILKARGMTATFFMITGKLGADAAHRQNNAWQPSEPLINHMIWPEVAELFGEGFSIGSHTVSHTGFNFLTPEQQTAELQQSRLDLQTHLPGNPVSFFAYPYGEGTQYADVRGRVQAAGYSAAVGFPNKPPRGLANPSTSNLYALPRMEIKTNHTLVLDETNPFWFFMRQVDPNFPIPNATVTTALTIKDAVGTTGRTAFYAGETITMTVMASNYYDEVPVVASLDVTSPDGSIYRSHETIPSQDVYTPTLKYGYRLNSFSYTLETPSVSTQTPYSYTFSVRDPSYLLEYHTFPAMPAFTVQPYPVSSQVSPNSLHLLPNQTRDLIFTVDYTGADGAAMYLTISYSPTLEVTQALPAGNWTYYPPGSVVKQNGCNSPCVFHSAYPIYEKKDDPFGGGVKAYTLQVRRIPGLPGPTWIRYRVSITAPGALTPNPLREPRIGSLDQQAYASIFIPLDYQIHLPLTMH